MDGGPPPYVGKDGCLMPESGAALRNVLPTALRRQATSISSRPALRRHHKVMELLQ
jgi:hypothetical protein